MMGCSSAILNDTPVVCIHASYNRTHIVNAYIYIHINTELLDGNKGQQEEIHNPTHRFRRLFLDLLSMGWTGCASAMGAIKPASWENMAAILLRQWGSGFRANLLPSVVQDQGIKPSLGRISSWTPYFPIHRIIFVLCDLWSSSFCQKKLLSDNAGSCAPHSPLNLLSNARIPKEEVVSKEYQQPQQWLFSTFWGAYEGLEHGQ